MPIIQVKGVSNPMQFPDDMDITDIRTVLRNKFPADMMKGANLPQRQDVAAPYKPTLAERMGQTTADFLHDRGIISDRYGAQRIGKNLTTLGEFLPGIGDATAGDEFGRAYAEGDKTGMLMAGAGAMPILGDMAIFAGVLAKNANLGALSKAKLLEDTGADRNKIWKETGWFNDRGDWKFEIDDSEAQFMPLGRQDQFVGDFGMVVSHPELNKGYSDIEDIDVLGGFKRGGTHGSYSPGTPGDAETFGRTEEISVNFPPDRKSTLLHEAQHAVQQREGFARGGNVGQFSSDIDALNSLNEMSYSDMDDFQRAMYKDLKSKYGGSKTPFEAYQRLAGEAESRNVQTRLDMSPEERRAKPPWETLDVPENELIYRKSGGVSQSALPMDDLPKFSDKVAARRDARLDVFDLPTKGNPENIKHITDLTDYTPKQLVSQLKVLDQSNIKQGGYLKKGDGLNTFYKNDGTSQLIDPKTNKVVFENSQEQTENLAKNDILEISEGKLSPEQRKIEFDAKKKANAEARAKEEAQQEGYKMQHTAPMREDNSTGHDLTSSFGDDIYTGNAVRYFGGGTKDSLAMDTKAVNIIQGMRSKPEKVVTIYRAVPKGVKEINPSDWVTTTKEYAQGHMEGEKGWHIISKKVKAKDIATDGNSIHEFGYDPVN